MRAPRARDFTHFLHFVTGFLRSARKNTCFFRKNGYNLGDTNKCSILKKSAKRLPPTLTQSVNDGVRAFGHSRLTKTNICRGAGLPSRLTESYSSHSVIRFYTRFFFVSAGAKKKLTKRNAKRRRAKGNFLKKVSFGILQKLLHGTCQTFAVCTQLTLKAPPQGGF